MLSELVKFTSQHRAFYCYLIMSVWIFLIIAGMYKYIVTEEGFNVPKPSAFRKDGHNMKGDSKMKKLTNKFCYAAENIHFGSEGMTDDSWALQGVMVVIRHGDRGPLTHVRGIENTDCDVPTSSPLLQRYQEYITNMTAMGKAPWSQSPGPFHNLPLLPGPPTSECRLGQLTPRGLLQLLKTGLLMGQAYTTRLGWDFYGNKTDPEIVKTDTQSTKGLGSTKGKIQDIIKGTKNSPLRIINNDEIKNIQQFGKPADGDIIVHCTRYRRAFQSALALMWAALGAAGGAGGGGVGGATIKESHSLTFCSEDCACPAAEHYARKVSQEAKRRFESHPAIAQLITQLSDIVFQSPSQAAKDPHILQDALLAYICHSAPLPCIEKSVLETANNQKKDNKKTSIKIGNKGLRALLQNENKASNPLKQSDFSSKRSLLNVFSLDNFEHSLKENTLVRRMRDIPIRSLDSQRRAPLLDFDSQMEKEKLGYYQQKMMENADMNYEDVILIKRNMDGDFNFNGDNPNNPEMEDADSEDYDDRDENEKDHVKKSGNIETVCVRKDQVTGLFSYTDWELKQIAKSNDFKKASLLRAYGMIHHIVQYILKMISDSKPKFVLFSGHDKTLQYLSLALGLSDDNLMNMHYASRLVIEIYKNEEREYLKNRKNSNSRFDNHKPKIIAPLDFFLRVVMNGQDVTRQVSFCRGSRSILADNLMKSNGPTKGKNRAYLCRIENIIRFTHEDYFSIFNASNFKDACSVH